ncbi:MAG: SBBP repeat-containing protein [Leptospira sp.]|nr:SBBP repeat-containing protein [Leptospira sp.]
MPYRIQFKKRITKAILALLILISTEACLYNPIIRSLLSSDLPNDNNNFLSLLLLGPNSGSLATSAPESISYGSIRTFRLVPDVSLNLRPTVSGVVDSWSISPSLPSGLSFDTASGTISGAPNASYFSTGFPLTTFLIKATNALGSTEVSIEIQIVASGGTVWTVLHGVTGRNTGGGTGSLFFDTATNSLYSGGFTTGSLDGASNPYPTVQTAFATKYDLNGNRIWTQIVPLSLGAFSQTGLALDSTANVIISGTTFGANTGQYDSIPLTTDQNLGITKFDSNGTKLWSVAKAGTELASSGIATDSSGNIFSTGNVKNNLDGVTNSGSTDSAVTMIKYDASGLQVGLPTLVGNGFGAIGWHNEGYGINMDSLGNLWTSGMSMSTNTCATANGQRTIVLYKFNSSMAYQTCYSLASSPSTDNLNFAFAPISDPSNNVYITGYTSSDLDGLTKVSTAASGYFDAFIAKFDSSGTLVWKRQLAVLGNTDTRAYAIVRSPDNFYYITGYTNANLNGEILNGIQDLFVAKYDSSGTLIWVKLIGSTGSTLQGNGLAFDTNNTLYVSGISNGDVGGVTNPVKPNNAHILLRFVK